MHRRELIKSPSTRGSVLGALPYNKDAKSAVDEFYTWVIGTYLPTRFPRIFHLAISPADSEQFADSSNMTLYNTATEEHIPLAPLENPVATLELLGGQLEDDFAFLMPSDDGDGYKLVAFVCCFPNGFDMSKKLGLKLRDIHAPVPGYKKILQSSMDRFFDKLETGKFVKRSNVSHVFLRFAAVLTPNSGQSTPMENSGLHEVSPYKFLLRHPAPKICHGVVNSRNRVIPP